MKQTSKIFIWISMALTFYLIFPIVVGVYALRKLDNAKSSHELQSMAIVTIFFCSILGGIFMLCVKDEELLKESYYKQMSKDEVVMTLNPFYIIYATICCILGIISLCVLATSFVYSIYCCESHNGSVIPLILSCIEIVLIIAILFFIFRNRVQFSRKILFVSNVLFVLCCFSLVSLLQFVICLIGFALYGDIYLVLFICGILLFLLPLAIMIYSWATKQMEKKTEKHIRSYIVGIEPELNHAKALFEKGVITGDEYQNIRGLIIAKYYNS